jgi:hypothetical protein
MFSIAGQYDRAHGVLRSAPPDGATAADPCNACFWVRNLDTKLSMKAHERSRGKDAYDRLNVESFGLVPQYSKFLEK